MTTARTPAHRRAVAGLVAGLLLVAACSSGDDTAADTDGADTTTTEPTSTSEPTDTTDGDGPDGGDELYPDHDPDTYAGTTNWICHPDLDDDPCRDLRTTVIDPTGTVTVIDAAADPDAAFDCFYAYPTTSTDPEVNSDLSPDASEIDTVVAQAARFASVCRVFAPVYRSVTLGGLATGAFGTDAGEVAYADVLDAWRTYADEFGDGRGVVLIGHSQGAGHLSRLITEEVGTDPAALERVISAVIMGNSVGELPGLAPCESADEFGCVITFSSYAATEPPQDGALFGRQRDGGGPAVCVDPTALAGGDGLADVVLPARGTVLGAVDGFGDLDTPFVSLPGALRTECVESGDYGYLEVSLPGVEDVRPLEGLLVARLGASWGLHLLDGNVAQDDVIEVVERQAAAFADD